jgi:hypothetical protein
MAEAISTTKLMSGRMTSIIITPRSVVALEEAPQQERQDRDDLQRHPDPSLPASDACWGPASS